MRFTAVWLLTCSAVAFAADPVASVDFTGGEQGRILVQAKINDRGPFPFIFDTGSVNLISLELAMQLGVKVSGKRTMSAFGGSVETASAVLDSIQLGALTMGQTEVTVIGGGPFTKGGPVGFLGWEFLSKLVVEVDYEHGHLNFYDPKTYRYTGQGARLPLTTYGLNMLEVPAEIFGFQANIQLDSGSEAPLVLYTKFVSKHDLHSKLDAVTGYGFGGLTRAMVVRAPALTIGGFSIKSPVVHLSLDRGGIESSDLDGNMGGPLLREFTCIYDVPQLSFYLQPNSWFGKQELVDRSGVVADTRGGSAKVLFVYPGSPAADAGIAAGDELSDQNGHPLTDSEWHDLLDNAAGMIVHVTVNHAGRVRSVNFTLNDYIR
ncbi:MAG: aspartyl protease family protein [Bryobacteraceae bacterium]